MRDLVQAQNVWWFSGLRCLELIYIHQAFAQGTLPSAVFSFFLSATASELNLGGTTQSLFSGPIEPHPSEVSSNASE